MAEDNDKDATGTYSAAARAPENTGTYGAESQETFSYSELREKEFKSRTHGLGEGDKLRLSEQDFTISEIISQGTGEAVIYKVQDEHNNTFAAKLYFEFSNPKEEPNEETLKRVKEIDDPDILKLHDFGVGLNKYLDKFCYEISDYAEGGDLFSVDDFRAKYTPQFIEKIIIPETFKGIKKFHSYKIYHCDLKPGNIFYLDQDQTNIVIGDYGSAKAYDLEAEQDLRKSSTIKGTEAYLAPEQARGIVSQKNDYYSFGIILLHLLYPESISTASNLCQIDKNKFERIVERQHNSQPVVDFDPKCARLNQLIEGLTLSYHVNRWGQTEVEKWLNGEDVEVRYRTSETESVKPIKLGYKTIRTEKEFVDVLENNPAGYEDLIGDPDTYSTVKSWLDSYRDIPTRKVFDGIVRYYQPFGKPYVKDALIRFFEPERPVNIDMRSFDIYTADNLKKEVESFIAKLDEIWKITALEKMRFYLFQLEFSLRQRQSAQENKAFSSALIDKFFSVFGLAQGSFAGFGAEIFARFDDKNEKEAFHQLLNLFYSFDPDRVFKDKSNKPLATLEDLGLFYARNEPDFLDKFLVIEKERYLKKIGKESIGNLPYIPFVFEVFKDKAESKVELVDLTFDKGKNYKISYNYYKSLKAFLKHHGIVKDFISRSDNLDGYQHRKNYGQSVESICEVFINAVCTKHNISKLSEQNLSEIRERFKNDSHERSLYLRLYPILPKSLPNRTLEQLREDEEKTGKKIHWEKSFVVAIATFVLTVGLLFAFAVYAGWIPLDKSTRYITFSKPVKLDGVNYAKDDSLQITNETDYNVCTKSGSAEKCYPTAVTAAMFSRLGNSSPIDKLGKIDHEFSYARDVFKASKDFFLSKGRKKLNVKAGAVLDIRIENGSWCFTVGDGSSECYAPSSRFHDDKGKDTGDFYQYGTAMTNYRGRRMFTPSQNIAVDGVSFQKATSIEVTKETPWTNCLKTSSGEKCFLTDTAMSRLKQADVPVLLQYGTIDTRKNTMTDFGYKSFVILAFLAACFAFWGTLRLAKQIRLLALRGEINTLKFKNFKGTTA